MPDGTPLETRGLRFGITVPCDDRFRPILGTLCERLARYVGYAQAEAVELAGTVVHATDGVLSPDGRSIYHRVDVTIATDDREMAFQVRYVRAEAAGSGVAPEIRQLLSTSAGGEAPLDILQRVMQRVDFGTDDGVEFCILTTPLPPERSSPTDAP